MQNKFFLYILFFLNIIKIISSDYSFGETVEKTHETFEYSMEKDMGQCTCDLSSLCDYNCECDKDCGNTEIEGKDRLEEYKCKSLKKKFEYNRDEAGISIKDHIFSLMCIHTDNSGDMGEFYKENPNEDNEQKKNDWINSFFKNNENTETNTNENLILYKPDSNGYCITTTVSKLKNNEFSCIMEESNHDYNDFLNLSQYGDDNINLVGKKENGAHNAYAITHVNTGNRKVELNLFWDINNVDKRPNGYMQGSPIEINYNGRRYDKYFFPIIDRYGNCLENGNEDNAISIKSFLFKNNAIYSCRINNNNIENLLIYNFLNGRESAAKICSSPDKEHCTNQIESYTNNNINNQYINITLYIYTSKEGKESNLHEIIKGSLAEISRPNEVIGLYLIFNIKFIDISSSSYYNTKEGKITSLTALSDKLLKSISVNN